MCLPDGGGQVELLEFSQACTGHSTGKHIYALQDGNCEGGRLQRHAATMKSDSDLILNIRGVDSSSFAKDTRHRRGERGGKKKRGVHPLVGCGRGR